MSSEIYDDSTPVNGQMSDELSVSDKIESGIATANDDLVITASEADKDILQRSHSSGTKSTSVYKGPMSFVTAPSLVASQCKVHERPHCQD